MYLKENAVSISIYKRSFAKVKRFFFISTLKTNHALNDLQILTNAQINGYTNF